MAYFFKLYWCCPHTPPPCIELDSVNSFALNKAILYYFRKVFLSFSDHKNHWAGIKNIDSQATPQCSELESPMIGPGNVYFYKRSAGNSHDWVSLRNTILIHEMISKGCLFCYLRICFRVCPRSI